MFWLFVNTLKASGTTGSPTCVLSLSEECFPAKPPQRVNLQLEALPAQPLAGQTADQEEPISEEWADYLEEIPLHERLAMGGVPI